MATMIERIAAAEEQAAAIKKQAAADARARIDAAQQAAELTDGQQVYIPFKAAADARAEQRAKLAEAEKQAEAEGQKLFDAIMAENAERADSERAAAAKKLYAAAEYIIGKAGQA